MGTAPTKNKARKRFFFEKKNQKTFVTLRWDKFRRAGMQLQSTSALQLTFPASFSRSLC
jgi:hypothetical protein